MDWVVERDRFEATDSNNANAADATTTDVNKDHEIDEECASPTRSKAIFRPRESAGHSEVKSRHLSDKIEVLLDLIFRRLFFDPAQPEVVFNHDGLLRLLKKIDKDLGP